MTMTLGESTPASVRPRRQPLVLCAAVATIVAVGLVLIDHWWTVRGIQHVWGAWLTGHISLFVLVWVMGGYVAYAAVLALWGRTWRGRIAGAGCALASGMYIWALVKAFDQWVWGEGNASTKSYHAYQWAFFLVTPTLAALAWGLARREGRRWVLGLVAAPLLAGGNYALILHSGWWRANVYPADHTSWVVERIVFVVPIIAACLTCWALERPSEMRTSASSEDAQTRRSRG